MQHGSIQKQHCAFGFWKASLMKDPEGILKLDTKTRGNFDRITSLKDLPSDNVMISHIKDAARLNDDEINYLHNKKRRKKIEVPDGLTAALKKNKKAQTTFEKFSPTNKRKYIEWITDAKTETTRVKRLETAIEWIAEGKVRNWKYVK